MGKNNLREALSVLVAESGVAVTKVEPGFRALARAAAPKLEKKAGRPAKEGERYPGGKLKSAKPAIKAISPALLDRLRTEAVEAVRDARFGSELGRLFMHEELTATQASAGYRLAQIYGRFERFKNMRRSAASPSYMVASSGLDEESIEAITPEMLARSMAEEMLDPEQLKDLKERIRSSEHSFEKLQNFMRVFPTNVRAAIELLCVDDALTNPMMLENLRVALDELAISFRIKAAPKKEKLIRREVIVEKDRSETVVPDVDRVVWFKAVGRLRPDMTEAQLAKAYELTCVLKVREVMERQKRDAKRTIHLHPKDAEFRKRPEFRRRHV
jgi:hypothetical protein